MKLHYTELYYYSLDESYYNITLGLVPEPFNSLECVKIYNENWAKVISNLLKDFKSDYFQRRSVYEGYDNKRTLNEVFTINRLDADRNMIYDFGFDIDKTLKYIKSINKEPIKFSLSQFGEAKDDLPIIYQHYVDDTPLKLEPIILASDFVTGRSFFYERNENMLDLPLVIDGNKRVSYTKLHGFDTILGYYINLKEIIENKLMLSRLDEAILSQTDDSIRIAKLVKGNMNENEFVKAYEEIQHDLFLNLYFNDLF
ncbi:hypothetical protein [Macrococcus capreoli]|uniref:hypothetical protein n=1 Tax=Macrococcus capreoli TaxID=2982690 RepID=UPI003EE681BB